MRLLTRLRELRGERTIAEIARASGVDRPYVSQIERGVMLPRAEWVPGLEQAYGAPIADWYDSWLTARDGTRLIVTLELEDPET